MKKELQKKQNLQNDELKIKKKKTASNVSKKKKKEEEKKTF